MRCNIYLGTLFVKLGSSCLPRPDENRDAARERRERLSSSSFTTNLLAGGKISLDLIACHHVYCGGKREKRQGREAIRTRKEGRSQMLTFQNNGYIKCRMGISETAESAELVHRLNRRFIGRGAFYWGEYLSSPDGRKMNMQDLAWQVHDRKAESR